MTSPICPYCRDAMLPFQVEAWRIEHGADGPPAHNGCHDLWQKGERQQFAYPDAPVVACLEDSY